MSNKDFCAILYFRLLLISFSVFLIALQVYRVMHYSMWFDDALFSNVAKSLVNKEGYSSVIFDHSYPFHYNIGAGPLLILPAAFMIWIFGNQYWVPGITVVILIWAMLLINFVFVKDLVGEEKRWQVGFLSLLMMLLFSVGSYGNENTTELTLWHLLMGEIPAVLCLTAGTFILFGKSNSRKKIILGAFFIGLSIMSKTLSAISASVILSVWGLKTIFSKDVIILQRVKLIAIVGFFSLVPFLVFDLAKMMILGWQEYVKLQAQNVSFYHYYAVITSTLQDNGVTLKIDTKHRFTYLKNFFGLQFITVVAINFYLLVLAFISVKRNSESDVQSKQMNNFLAGLALVLCFFVQALWWVNLSTGCDRHLVIGLMCYCCGVVVLLSCLDYKKLPRICLVILFCALFVLMESRQTHIEYLFNAFFQNDDKRLEQEFAVVEEIKKLQLQGVELFACGNNLELEYLLPRSKNFRKCDELLEYNSSKKAMLVSYFVSPKIVPYTVIRGDSDKYYFLSAPLDEKFRKKCAVEYMKTENFSLNWCQ